MPATNDRLIRLIIEVKHVLRERFAGRRGIAAAYTSQQIAALCIVKERGAPTMTEVARLLRVSPPTASDLVAGLVRTGLLRRVADAGDRRSVRLRLTPEGRRTHAAGLRTMYGHMRAVLAVLTPAERRQLQGMLERLTKTFTS